jgi:hypothetical protein
LDGKHAPAAAMQEFAEANREIVGLHELNEIEIIC